MAFVPPPPLPLLAQADLRQRQMDDEGSSWRTAGGPCCRDPPASDTFLSTVSRCRSGDMVWWLQAPTKACPS
jgi:hypothetical protein